MPKTAFVRRPVAVAATAMIAASSFALLVSSTTAPPAGADVAPGSTQRASVSDSEEQASRGGGNAACGFRSDLNCESVISGDGNSMAFVSNNRLDPSLDNGSGESQPYFAVYVRDLVRGRTVMISRGHHFPPEPPGFAAPRPLTLNGAQQDTEREEPPEGDSSDPTISANGRYVAFKTFAANVAPFGTFNSAIVLCDRDPDNDGVFDEDITTPAGVTMRDYRCQRLTSGSSEGPRVSLPRLAADTNRIVWQSSSSSSYSGNFLQSRPLNQDINGLITPGPIEDVPAELDGFSNFGQFDPAISGDGNRIAMHGEYSENCDCDGRQFNAIMVTDMRTRESTRVDFENNEPIGTDLSVMVMHPALSFDGTTVAFVAEQFDANGSFSQFDQPYVYVVTVDYGRATAQVTRSVIASRDNTGTLATGRSPALSADGRYVAFVTDALRMHDGVDRPLPAGNQFSCIHQPRIGLTGQRPLALNGAIPPERPNIQRTSCQVVVRDLVLDQNSTPATRVPGTLAGPGTSRNCIENLPPASSCVGDGESESPSLTEDGSRIGFDSQATDLVSGDTNKSGDVFVRTLEPTLRGAAINFGPVELPGSLIRSTDVELVGSGPLPIDAVTLTGTNSADFAVTGQTCQEVTLHQRETCRITVEFTPGAVGDRSGQLLLRTRPGRNLTINLTGSGTEKPVPRGPEFSVNPKTLEFGQRPLLTVGADGVVTVTNTGEQPMTITTVTVVGPGAPGDYSVGTNTCTAPVPGGGTCQVSVRFLASLPGDRVANLQFTHNAPGSPSLISLHGSAGPMSLEANPGVTPPGRVITVTGKGYPPGKTVTVSFTTAAGTAKATVGPDGIFRAQLMIFHKAKPENRTVVATVDGSPALFANANLLVVFPTVKPADFVVRG